MEGANLCSLDSYVARTKVTKKESRQGYGTRTLHINLPTDRQSQPHVDRKTKPEKSCRLLSRSSQGSPNNPRIVRRIALQCSAIGSFQ
jgi:hypothetical protein